MNGSWSVIHSEKIGWNMNQLSLRAKVFGEMVKLANPTRMVAHAGDLYYDALYLDDKFQVMGTWTSDWIYFGVRDTGTQIDTSLHHLLGHNTDYYKIRVDRYNTARRGPSEWEYTLTIKRYEPNGAS